MAQDTVGTIILKLKRLIVGSSRNTSNTYTQTYSVASKSHPNMTSADVVSGGVGSAAGGFSDATTRDQAITEINALRADVIALKQVVNALIDDNQTIGISD